MTLINCILSDVKCFIGLKFKGYGAMNDILPKNWVIVWNKKKKSFGFLRMLNICPVSRNKSHPEDTWDPYEIIPLCHASKPNY